MAVILGLQQRHGCLLRGDSIAACALQAAVGGLGADPNSAQLVGLELVPASNRAVMANQAAAGEAAAAAAGSGQPAAAPRAQPPSVTPPVSAVGGE